MLVGNDKDRLKFSWLIYCIEECIHYGLSIRDTISTSESVLFKEKRCLLREVTLYMCVTFTNENDFCTFKLFMFKNRF